MAETLKNETKRSRSEQQRAQETRVALVAAARTLFGDIGYHAAGTGEVVAAAAITRGALYHHFGNKEGLFEAVYREVAQEQSDAAQAATREMAGQTWARVIATVTAYLELVVRRRDYQRILLIDGPAVFGWQRWRELRADYALAGWVKTLSLLADQGIIARGNPEPMAHLILAAMDDAALTVAHSPTPEIALAEMTEALFRLLGGLKLAA